MADKLLPIRSTPIEAALIMRASGQSVTGNGTWFGPQQPIKGMAPDSADGRAFDYAYAVNQLFKPRSETGENWIDFTAIRQLCDPAQGGPGILRGAIETVKNQMGQMKWEIQPKDKKNKAAQKECDRVTELLKRPDGRHFFSRWRRKLLEDHLTIDHPIIYKEPTKVKGIYLPRIIDGATIKLVLDGSGQVPMDGKAIAFQQQLKGMPARNYTSDQILWFPFNLLPQRAYAMGPVEQFIDIVTITLKRGLHVMNYYTDGTVPDALVGCPTDWGPQQIKEMQMIVDGMLAGDLQARRRMHFVPGGTDFIPTKDPVLKNEQDEWLAKVICWCYSVSAGPLVKDQTKATAGVNKITATEEGMIPRKEWFKEVMDTIIADCYGAQDCEFVFQEEEVIDPKTKAQITQLALGGATKAQAWLTIDEARDFNGYEAMTDDQRDELDPEPEPPPIPPIPGQPGNPSQVGATANPQGAAPAKPLPDAQPGIQKLAKAAKPRPINRNRPSVKRSRKIIEQTVQARFNAQKAGVLKALARLGKADLDDYAELWDSIREDQEQAQADMQAHLLAMAKDGGDEALDALSVDDDSITDLVHKEALDWAQEHAAELVSGVDDTTRDGLRDLVNMGIEEGQSTADIAKGIQDYAGFNEDRAKLIARTETARADFSGNMIAWKQSGVVAGRIWQVDDDPCPDCLENEDAGDDDGMVPLDEEFPNGDAPAHPSCFLPGTVVAASGVTKHLERWFEGEVVRLVIEGQDTLSVTPNHPILTRRGWVAARELQEGDDLFRVSDPGTFVRLCNPENHHMETRIEEVADALLMAGGVASVSMPVAAEHFHGDGIPGQDVSVVRANGGLDGALDTAGTQHGVEPRLVLTDADLMILAGGSRECAMFKTLGLPSNGLMGLGGSGESDGSGNAAGLHSAGVGHAANGEAQTVPSIAKGAAVAAQRAGEIHAALSNLVAPVKVQKVIRGEQWRGHVYNLQTEGGWYVAGSIIAHNCDCDMIPVLSDEEED